MQRKLARVFVLVSLVLVQSMSCGVSASSAGRGEKGVLLRAPFQAQRGSFYYSLLGVPRFESAELLPSGTTVLRMRTDHSNSEKGPRMDNSSLQAAFAAGATVPDSFVGFYHSWAVIEVTRGLTDWLEAGIHGGVCGWDEHRDHAYFFDEQGRPLVRGEVRDIYGWGPSGRDDDFGNVAVNFKIRLRGMGDPGEGAALAVVSAVKAPVGEANNLTHAGTTDISLGLAGTCGRGPWILHFNSGGVLPAGSQTVFIREDDVELDPFLFGAVGAMWTNQGMALGVQVEGNTSAFGDVPFLDGPPVTILAGVRAFVGGWFLEGGAGKGLNRAAYDGSWFMSAGRAF